MDSHNPGCLRSLGRLLGFASRATRSLSERRLCQHGLTLPQWAVMTALWRQTGLTESELAEYARSTPSALSRILDRMSDAGLVRRREDPDDGRRVRVELGPKGRKLSPLLDFYQDINAVLLQGFTNGEAKQVVAYLERITRNAEAALDAE